MITPVSREQLIKWAKEWVKLNGIDSLIEQYVDYQLFMMKKFKEGKPVIKEVQNETK